MLDIKRKSIELNDYENAFVISDIHGNLRLFNKMLKEIDLKKEDLLIINGDSCDRGANTAALYQAFLALQKDGYQLIHNLGNHEELFYNAQVFSEKIELWSLNGGQATLDSYQGQESLIEEHLDFIEGMTLLIESEDYIIVHAGLNPKKRVNEQNKKDLIWIRDQFLNKRLSLVHKTVVFGHTVTKDAKIAFYPNNTIGIDCGSCNNNRLGALELKSKQEYYVN